MKHFKELTEEEQELAISRAAKSKDLPLFQNIINDSMRLLLSAEGKYMFDEDLVPIPVQSLDQ